MAQRKTANKSSRTAPAKKKKPSAGRGNVRGKKSGRGRKKSGGSSWLTRMTGSVSSAVSAAWNGIADTAAGLHDRLWCQDEEEEKAPPKKRSRKTNGTGGAKTRGGKKRARSDAAKKGEETTMAEELENMEYTEKTEAADEAPVEAKVTDESSSAPQATPEEEEVSWNQQLSSIIFGVLSLLMLSLIVFKGENLWTAAHNFIFGLFGNMAIFWNALLVYSGYMFAKQKGPMRILEITRAAAGIIVFIDVLNYILIQSNCYRNVYNEITYSPGNLALQIYSDGSRLGGTGLIGAIVGEILLRLLGKLGGSIVCILALFGLAMLISHTTPVALIESIRRNVTSAWNVATAMFREELPQTIRSILRDEQPEAVSFADSGEEAYDDYGDEYDETRPDDIFVFTDEPDDREQVVTVGMSEDEKQSEAEDIGKELGDLNVGDIIRKVSLIKEEKKRRKKMSRAEEIQEQKEAFAQQVETAETGDGSEDSEPSYQFPTLRLLIAPKNTGDADGQEELRETADKLINTLAEYGVKASISDISRGPTVTRYEINPAPGVKINKITNLSNDIALRLAAQSIRIEAPIPGKPAVGIEIPNKNKQMVRIREIIGSREFAEAKGSLMVALGKDIEGNIVLCDLSKMPHLLIAGSTGSGKSVCVNSMLMSLLYKYSPKEVRMVLIDPKSVEFDMYNGIPHLLVPVVCEPKKAAGALQWAVSEMLKRYGMLKEHGVRNIDNYNRVAEETGEFEKLCRIVIVIDEMADLMIASPKEVEDAIARLAAMARAAGMYMVLATQRPSVDVITGTIKNNIPSRIALAVSSQIDSRTILDEGGAENLIGYGDMLYHPMGASKHTRVQGCFVDDVEVERVIRYVKRNGAADYDDSIADEIERNSMDGSVDNAADFSDKDEFFEKAVEVVTEAGQASTSMLQRRLGVGYARAGRIIDQLEEQGIIGPYEGSKPRAVLITHAQWLEMTMSKLPSGRNDPLIRSHSEFAAQTLDNGHEEITARQSEFFNADEAEDEYEEEFFPEDEPSDEPDETFAEEAPAPQVRDFTQFFAKEEQHDAAEEEKFLPPEEDAFVPEEEFEEAPAKRVRDFTQFFTKEEPPDAAEEEKFLPPEEDVFAPEEESGEAPAPQVRDFTQFFAKEEQPDAAEEETFLPPEEDALVPEEEFEEAPAPQVRDFTQFFTKEEQSDTAEEETFLPPEEDAFVPEEEFEEAPAPQVRDFTRFFDDDEEDDAPILPAADKTGGEDELPDIADFFTNDSDTSADDLPPWEAPPVLTEQASLREENRRAPSSVNLFDEDDEDALYDDILSADWIHRLDDGN